MRDNGAVYRRSKEKRTKSKWDEEWTFGKFDPRTGYMLIGQERVHRIVCTAYHGDPIGDRNVVDHIDTNRCNNRPENLRWVTKLENTILNPITRAKIEALFGSVEAFLENPSVLYGHESEDPNFTWMRSVTKEEAERSLKRWNEWATKPVEERKNKGERKGPDEWLFSDLERKNGKEWMGESLSGVKSWAQQKEEIEMMNLRIWEEEHGLKDSLTSGAKQLNWKTPTEFLLCPSEGHERTLQAYMNNLVKGQVFTRTQYEDGGIVLDYGINEVDNAIYVLSYKAKMLGVPFGKPWALCKIFLMDGFYVHENQGSFFHEDGGQKSFTLAMGREWAGGEVFDDGVL